MTFVLFFSAIAFLLLGYYIMDKIDKFTENNMLPLNEDTYSEHLSSDDSQDDFILIYGDNALTDQVKAYCDTQHYQYKTITDIHFFCTTYKYNCLLVLSYSDVDNLITSSVAIKVYSISRVIALCNIQNNFKIYNDFHFDKVILYQKEIDILFSSVKESLQNAVKQED